MEIVGVATPHHLKRAMRLKDTHSSYVSSQKLLKNLSDLGKLERANGVYKLPACKSEGGDHALAVTQVIAEVFNRFDDPQVYKEKLVEGKGVRPDLMVLARRNGQGLCFIVEVTLQETEDYLTMKRNVWQEWPEALVYLSNLFKTPIKHFDFLTSETLNQYLEEVCAG